ncbi:MAG TPA: NF038122 family metalloprotease [Phenylobacterium sp.]|jgi:hypothetical protein|uniref:NF038122 family metalloprotease n=1 Tax=Phenylobacterium sp. TaxID=1871053 RepID=UPI002D2ACE43|nr:NF038122 family metalloprotease [Phenylobacterium sp.]HZZ66645.1 NF038122 family metalloprotease [Phenylobacterium sp.]
MSQVQFSRGRPRAWCFGALAGAATISISAPAAALTIIPKFDASITALSNAGAVEAAFNTVAADYDSVFSNAVNINVDVSWGSVAGKALPGGAIGASSDNLYGYFTLAQIKSDLAASSARNPADTALATAVKSIPATIATGPSKFVLPSAEAKALGLVSGASTSIDGYIGFGGTTSGYSFNPLSVAAGTYDFEAVAAHELAEVLGRMGGVDSTSPAWRSPFDLFRYSAPGVLDAGYNDAAYFSVNGGVTDLKAFNNSPSGGDRSDWLVKSGVHDVQDAFQNQGSRYTLSNVDLTALDVLGWGGGNAGDASLGNPTGQAFGLVLGPDAVPEPASWALLILGFFGLGSTLRSGAPQPRLRAARRA